MQQKYTLKNAFEPILIDASRKQHTSWGWIVIKKAMA